MSDILCRYQNSGYCKYKDNCTFKHVTEECNENKCSRKTCKKRHLKWCRYGVECRILLTCEFKHKTNSEEAGLKSQIKELEETIKNLVVENKTYMAKLAALEIEIETYQKEVVNENEEKKTLIKTLRQNLRKEEKNNEKYRKDIEEKENEIIKRDKVIKAMKEETEAEKKKTTEEVKSLVKTLKCDMCHFGGMNENDLRKHKTIHHKVKDTTRRLACDRSGTFFSSDL